MTFVFWQGIISIHQKTFLEALAQQPLVDKVVLVVEEAITPYRKNMGWEVPDIAGVEIVRAPDTYEIQRIVRLNKHAVHTMGGIRVGRMMTIAFDACVQHKCHMGIMTEPYNSAGLKGRLRTFKYKYYGKKYFKYIQFVLAIGRQGVAQYEELGFAADRIFPWAYFVSLGATGKRVAAKNPNVRRIIYAGRLEEAKGITRFVRELAAGGEKNFILDIYGTGADTDLLKEFVTQNGLELRVNFYPFLRYDALVLKYAEYDWVVLPSSGKDGWGVIISEGLLNGLKAICSDICGVSRVIKDGFNGLVFNWNDAGSCQAAINRMLSEDSFADVPTITDWARQTISGEAGAAYFVDIIGCVYESQLKPELPWERGK